MGRLTDRRSARERILGLVKAELDRLIPEDESKPLKGGKFIEWEDQADELDRSVCAAFLEERAALDDRAEVDASGAGACPSCGSDRIYLIRHEGSTERQTPHGKVALKEQRCRCRGCGKHFSPSAGGVGVDGSRRVVGEGGTSGGAGGGDAKLRPGGRSAG